MNNTTLQIKFKQRLNKIASNDYDNIECWQIVESFNKAQISWCRRQLHGTNQYREGDEASKRRIDDLQILLTSRELTGPDITYDDQYGYFRADNFAGIYDPTLGNYLEFKRLEAKAVQGLTEIIAIEAEYDVLVEQRYKVKGGVDWTGEDPAAYNAEVEAAGGVEYIDQLSNYGDPSGNAYQYQLANFEWDENGYGPIIGDPIVTETLVEGTGIEGRPAQMAPGASKEKCCLDPRTMTIYLSEVANTDIILRDPLKNPDFEWGESFCTIQDNEIRVWRKDFFIVEPRLHYYRKPINIQILGCVDPYTGLESTVDVQCEFKDDIVELLIDEAISIIAGDISDPNQFQRGDSLMEKNN